MKLKKILTEVNTERLLAVFKKYNPTWTSPSTTVHNLTSKIIEGELVIFFSIIPAKMWGALALGGDKNEYWSFIVDNGEPLTNDDFQRYKTYDAAVRAAKDFLT